jgi:hypothetical protein
MNVQLHHLEHVAKQHEVAALLRSERMLDEEWDDRPNQIGASAHAIGCSVAMISTDDSTAKESTQRVKQSDVALVLHDGEFRKHLAARPHPGMCCDPDMKTAFTVHEACDPFRLEL